MTTGARTGLDTATFGGGCFWCLEAVFDDIRGVTDVVSGYAGGVATDPSYEMVCSGTTGHAEVVRITFDPTIISYRDLLDVLFAVHDPTTPNRQGHDVGTQYRSIILYHDAEQQRQAREYVQEMDRSGAWGRPIVTEIKQLDTFYPAEDYHQEYFVHNPDKSYCQVVVAPKVAKARAKFATLQKV